MIPFLSFPCFIQEESNDNIMLCVYYIFESRVETLPPSQPSRAKEYPFCVYFELNQPTFLILLNKIQVCGFPVFSSVFFSIYRRFHLCCWLSCYIERIEFWSACNIKEIYNLLTTQDMDCMERICGHFLLRRNKGEGYIMGSFHNKLMLKKCN